MGCDARTCMHLNTELDTHSYCPCLFSLSTVFYFDGLDFLSFSWRLLFSFRSSAATVHSAPKSLPSAAAVSFTLLPPHSCSSPSLCKADHTDNLFAGPDHHDHRGWGGCLVRFFCICPLKRCHKRVLMRAVGLALSAKQSKSQRSDSDNRHWKKKQR